METGVLAGSEGLTFRRWKPRMFEASTVRSTDTVPAAVKRDRARVYLDVAAQVRLLALDELDGIVEGAR